MGFGGMFDTPWGQAKWTVSASRRAAAPAEKTRQRMPRSGWDAGRPLCTPGRTTRPPARSLFLRGRRGDRPGDTPPAGIGRGSTAGAGGPTQADTGLAVQASRRIGQARAPSDRGGGRKLCGARNDPHRDSSRPPFTAIPHVTSATYAGGQAVRRAIWNRDGGFVMDVGSAGRLARVCHRDARFGPTSVAPPSTTNT